MSAYLSNIHYMVYDKIKYQEYLCDQLASLLYKKDATIVEKDIERLPEGDLKDCIKLNQIHDWLQTQMKKVEQRFSLLIDDLKRLNMIEEGTNICFIEGKKVRQPVYAGCNEVFQHSQSYMVDGMPCERGIQLLLQEPNQFLFHIDPVAHSHIEDITTYMKFRSAWLQGLVEERNFLIQQVDTTTFETKEEESLCTKS